MLRVRELEAFYGASQALFGMELGIDAGEVVTLMGRNGMGKTTTVSTIMGLLPARRGVVEFEGQRVEGLPSFRIARLGLGLVPEGRQIFPNLSVRENLVAAAANRLGAAEPWTLARTFDFLPRLAERQRNMGNQLSGGEQQMLAVARALVTDPRVILLDEPSQGLAPLVVEELTRLIMRLRDEGVSLLLVEQNLNLAEAVADVVYVMVKGQMVYHAPLERFRSEREEVKARYLTL